MAKSMSEYVQNGTTYIIDDPTIAPVFVESTAYSAGQYVKHEGNLYKLTAAHAANTTWANTSKTQVLVESEMRTMQGETSDLKSAITQIAEYSDYANLFDKSAVLTDKTLQVGSGKTINDVVDSTGSCVSGIIEVEPSTYYVGYSAFYGVNTAKIYGYNSLGA
jgi:hypothetical protein